MKGKKYMFEELKENGIIGEFKDEYEFLSNFCKCEINYEGIHYPSSEHAYQAAKTLDVNERNIIVGLKTGAAKKYGKNLILRDNWNKIKPRIMYDILKIKFSNKYFIQYLLDTRNLYLEEGNWWNDTYWGVCKGVGKNVLGKLLMKIREEIRNVC
jgi:ribA/ribD-fused uncharacterized protein